MPSPATPSPLRAGSSHLCVLHLPLHLGHLPPPVHPLLQDNPSFLKWPPRPPRVPIRGCPGTVCFLYYLSPLTFYSCLRECLMRVCEGAYAFLPRHRNLGTVPCVSPPSPPPPPSGQLPHLSCPMSSACAFLRGVPPATSAEAKQCLGPAVSRAALSRKR